MESQNTADRDEGGRRGAAVLKRDSSLAADDDIHTKRQKQESAQTSRQETVEVVSPTHGGQAETVPKEPTPAAVTLSRIDKAPTIQLSECLTKATSRKGYRTVRATHGVSEGRWYFEVAIEHLGETGHCRVGWATKQAHLHAPVGFDQYGYSYRDIEGTKQHKAERQPYGQPYSAVLSRHAWCSIQEMATEPTAPPLDTSIPSSAIAFFKNGDYQGLAFESVLKGTYFPAVSMFTSPQQVEGVTLMLNFGPDFIYSPISSIDTTIIPPPDALSEISSKAPPHGKESLLRGP